MKYFHLKFNGYELVVDNKTKIISNGELLVYQNIGLQIMHLPSDLIVESYFGPYLIDAFTFDEIKSNKFSGINGEKIERIEYILDDFISVIHKKKYSDLMVCNVIGIPFKDDFGLYKNNLFVSKRIIKFLSQQGLKSLKGLLVSESLIDDYLHEYSNKLKQSNYSYELPLITV